MALESSISAPTSRFAQCERDGGAACAMTTMRMDPSMPMPMQRPIDGARMVTG